MPKRDLKNLQRDLRYLHQDKMKETAKQVDRAVKVGIGLGAALGAGGGAMLGKKN